MRIVAVENLKPGMQLARTLYSDDGRVLLHCRAVLTKAIIKRIADLQYSYLYIRDPDDPVEEEEFLDPIKEETKAKATALVKETMTGLEKSNTANVGQLKTVVAEMVDQILADRQTVYNMMDIRTYDDYTFAHSVNVGILSLLTGSALGYNREDLEALGMGAILHDIGKILIPPEILKKPSRLDPGEYEKMKEHSERGYQLLKDRNVSYLAAHMAYEHHEREDGSGYPRGLTAARIHRFAKIVAVVDVFDAMTANRIYRKGLPAHLALREIQDSAVTKFDKTVVDCFMKIVAPYPVGSVVRLSNGEIATVIKVTRNQCLVKVHGSGPVLIHDLYQNTGLMVEEVFNL